MNEVLQVHKDAIVDFAKWADNVWNTLEPWKSENADNFKPPKSAFGAVSGDTNDIDFEFHLLTTAEFEEETGYTLAGFYQPSEDPTKLASTDAIYSLAVALEYGTYAAAVPSFGLSLLESPFAEEYANWYYYYAARGPEEALLVDGAASADAPWAEKMHKDWCGAATNRLIEVDAIRYEIALLLPHLDKCAEEYAATDLSNSIDIDMYEDKTIDTIHGAEAAKDHKGSIDGLLNSD